MTYKEKLLDPRWQKKRLEIFNRDDFTCQNCGNKDATLHAHHRRYLPKKDPWDIPDNLLITLCPICHENEFDINDVISGLGEMLKENFLRDSIEEIATGFLHIKMPHLQEVTASAIRWMLSDEKGMDELCKRYFESLGKIREVENG